MLWRLETPERDPDLCRRQNRALAWTLGGDPSVVNPGRVMRLGGSVAWPASPGASSSAPSSKRSMMVGPRSTCRASWRERFRRSEPSGPIRSRSERGANLNIGSEFDGVTVEACLAAIRAGDHWHDNSCA